MADFVKFGCLKMATVAVIGGGASGVASAYYLSRLAAAGTLKKVGINKLKLA